MFIDEEAYLKAIKKDIYKLRKIGNRYKRDTEMGERDDWLHNNQDYLDLLHSLENFEQEIMQFLNKTDE